MALNIHRALVVLLCSAEQHSGKVEQDRQGSRRKSRFCFVLGLIPGLLLNTFAPEMV